MHWSLLNLKKVCVQDVFFKLTELKKRPWNSLETKFFKFKQQLCFDSVKQYKTNATCAKA